MVIRRCEQVKNTTILIHVALRSPLLKISLVFMKSDNYMGGQYFAELTKSLLDYQETDNCSNIKSEYRLSIYGRKPGEWGKLAKWVVQHKLLSDTNRYDGAAKYFERHFTHPFNQS